MCTRCLTWCQPNAYHKVENVHILEMNIKQQIKQYIKFGSIAWESVLEISNDLNFEMNGLLEEFISEDFEYLKKLQRHESRLLPLSYYSGFIIACFNLIILIFAIILYAKVGCIFSPLYFLCLFRTLPEDYLYSLWLIWLSLILYYPWQAVCQPQQDISQKQQLLQIMLSDISTVD